MTNENKCCQCGESCNLAGGCNCPCHTPRTNENKCCEHGNFGDDHECMKSPTPHQKDTPDPVERVLEEFMTGIWFQKLDELPFAIEHENSEHARDILKDAMNIIRKDFRTTLATYGAAREAKGREEERREALAMMKDIQAFIDGTDRELESYISEYISDLTPPPQTDKPESV